MSDNFTFTDLKTAMSNISSWSENYGVLQECLHQLKRDHARSTWKNVENEVEARAERNSDFWNGAEPQHVAPGSVATSGGWTIADPSLFQSSAQDKDHATKPTEHSTPSDRPSAELLLDLLNRVSSRWSGMEDQLRNEIKKQIDLESADESSQQDDLATDQSNWPTKEPGASLSQIHNNVPACQSSSQDNGWYRSLDKPLTFEERDDHEAQIWSLSEKVSSLQTENARMTQANKVLAGDRSKMATKIWELGQKIIQLENEANHVDEDPFMDE